MEDKGKNIFNYLIPVVAVVIIVESVMVVSGLMKKNQGVDIDPSLYMTESDEVDMVDKVVEDMGDPKANFVFSVDSKEMTVGETYVIQLDLLPKESFSADAVDVYVSYDSEAFDVSGLIEGEDMPKAVSMRVSDKRNLVLANFWFTDVEGYVFEEGKPVSLLSFKVMPKKTGNFDFNISKGGQEELGITRMVVGQGEVVSSLAFSSDKLTVIINN